MPESDGFSVPAGAPQNRRADAIVDRLKAETAADASRVLSLTSTVNPDEHALAVRTSARTGVPVAQAAGAVKSDPRSARAFDERHEKLLRENPTLAAWLRNENNAGVSGDDVPALAALTQAARPTTIIGALPDAASAGMANLGAQFYHLAVVRGLVSPEAGAEAVADYKRRAAEIEARKPASATAFDEAVEVAGPGEGRPELESQPVARDDFGLVFRPSGRPLPDARKSLLASLSSGAETAVDVIGAAAKNPGGALYATAKNIPNAVPTLGLGLGGGLAAGPFGFAAGSFGGSYLTEYGAWIDQRMAERGIDMTDPTALATLYRDQDFMTSAQAEANRKALGTAGVDALLSFLAGRKLAGASGAKGKLKAGAVEVGQQAAGEVASEAAGQLAATGRLEVADVILEGLLSGPQSVAEVGIGTSLRAARQRQVAVAQEAAGTAIKAVQAQQDAEQAQQVAEAQAAAKAHARLPEAVRALVDQTAGKPAPQIAVEAWDAHWTAQGRSPVTEAERVTGSRTAYAEARSTGVLAMPYSRVTANLTDTDFAGLRPSIRYAPDGLTEAEAETALTEIPAALEEAAKAADEAAEADTESDADEARAEELVAAVGLPPDGDVFFQSSSGTPEPSEGDENRENRETPLDTGSPPPAGPSLRDLADAIEAAEPGLLGRLADKVLGNEPVADTVRGSLGALQSAEGPMAPTGEGQAPSVVPAGLPLADPLAAAAQADPAGTAAALRELADIRDRQAGRDGGLRRTITASLRAAGRPAKEADAAAAVIVAFVRTMQARYPEVAADLWERFGVRFARSAAPSDENAAYDPLSRAIHFFDGANPSSAFHEVGHWMLDVFGRIAADPAAPESLRKDYAAALAELGGTIDRAAHEKFARGFESYLYSGDAPSAALRRVFATVAAFMRRVYRELRALGGISPAMRQTFDRLLATDEEIARAEAETGLTPLFPTEAELTNAGIDPETATKYHAKVRAARDAEIEKLTRAALSVLAGEKKAERESVLEKLRVDIRARADKLPATEALARLTDDVRLDADAVADTLGEAMAGRLRKIGVTVEPGGNVDAGLTPEAAAELFGFDSADALARGLLLAGDIDKLVDAEARRVLAETRPDLIMGREELRRQARENVSREEVVSAELEILMEAQRAETRKDARAVRAETAEAASDAARAVEADIRRAAFASAPKLAVVREQAAAILSRKRLRDIRPSTYLSAVQREGRLAAQHVAAGNFQLAAIAKRNQSMNLALYRAAQKLIARAETNRRFLLRMAETPAQKILGKAGAGEGRSVYQSRVNAWLDSISLRRLTEAEAEFVKGSEDFATYVQSETGRRPEIPPRLLREMQRTNWRDMTAGALEDVRLGVESVYDIARTKHKLLAALHEREQAEQAALLVAAAEANRNAHKVSPHVSRTPAENRKHQVSVFYKSWSKVPEMARQLDGQEDGGAWWDTFVRPFNRAAAARQDWNGKLMEERARLNRLYLTDRERKDIHKRRAVPDASREYSLAERLMVLANMGNAGNDARLVGVVDEFGIRRGGTITEADRAAIVAASTEAHWRWAEGVAGLYQSVQKDVFDLEERVTGLRPKAVEPRPFTVKTADGKTLNLPGWYFPIRYAGRKGEQLTAQQEAQTLGRALTGRAMTAHGHTEARLEFVGNPLKLELSVIDSTLAQVVLDLTHREAVIDARNMLAREDIADALDVYGGAGVREQFDSLVASIATDDTQFYEMGDAVVNRVRRGISAAILGFRATTALVNTTGIVQSVERIGPDGAVWFARAAGRLVNPNDQAATAAWIYSVSPFMRGRGDNLTREVAESARLGDASPLQHFSFYMMGRTQALVDLPTWLGAYMKAMAADPTDETRAIDIADSVVREAQGSGDIIDSAAIQRGSAFRKYANIFYFYSSTTLARTSGAWDRMRVDDPVTYARFLADIALLYYMPGLLSAAIWTGIGAIRGDDEDDDETIWSRALSQAGRQAWGTIPFVRHVGPSGVRSPGDKPLEALGQVAVQAYNLLSAEEEFDPVKAATGLNMAAGIWFAYPADFINVRIKAFAAMLDGEAKPISLLAGLPRR